MILEYLNKGGVCLSESGQESPDVAIFGSETIPTDLRYYHCYVSPQSGTQSRHRESHISPQLRFERYCNPLNSAPVFRYRYQCERDTKASRNRTTLCRCNFLEVFYSTNSTQQLTHLFLEIMISESEARELYSQIIHFDGLNISNFSREIFEAWKAGGITGVSCTCGIWEGFRGAIANVVQWKKWFEEHSDLIVQVSFMKSSHGRC
jgi:hypothetical protein